MPFADPVSFLEFIQSKVKGVPVSDIKFVTLNNQRSFIFYFGNEIFIGVSADPAHPNELLIFCDETSVLKPEITTTKEENNVSS